MKFIKLAAIPALWATLAYTGLAQSGSVVSNAPVQAVSAPPPPTQLAAPQLIISGDQWVVQVPPNTPMPNNIVLQLSAPSASPAPGIVVQQPPASAQMNSQVIAQPSSGGEVVVESAPPPPPVEVIPMAPDHFHVWIGGHYEWTHHGYVWVRGRWERPPHHNARWVRSRWEFRNGRYVYFSGRWE